MKTPSLSQVSDDYDRIEKAIKFIEKNFSSMLVNLKAGVQMVKAQAPNIKMEK